MSNEATSTVVDTKPGANDAIVLGYRTYTNSKFPKHCNTCYYVTINGIQCGGVLFSMTQVNEAHDAIRRGEKW